MKVLKALLENLYPLQIIGSSEQQIAALHFDSRLVGKETLFVAIRGTQSDGHAYIAQAEAQGASAIVCEQLPASFQPHITYIQVADSAEALGQLAASFYEHPSRKLHLVAVTGTNGKTTNVTLLFQLFRRLGYNVGLLSTVQNQINEEVIPATHTTPDALQLNALLAQMVEKKCTHCFMEASSHAIVMRRIAGLHLAGAVFTNISHDHLDFHKTFDNYIKAKKQLFDELPESAFALVNIDDKRGNVMVQNTAAKVYHFALRQMAHFKGKVLDNTLQGLLMDFNGRQAWCRLIGSFNAYNLLGAFGVAVLLGEAEEQVLEVLSELSAAKGRFEQVLSPQGTVGIVDYAHTPDALENVLNTIQGLREDNQRIITVVGCGGNRDSSKRPLMAKIACRLSDVVLLTSDNPRHEEPMAIIEDMIAGLSPIDKKKVKVLPLREEAIRQACQMAQSADIILVAGKGHEDYQEIKGVKYPFDDKKILAQYLYQNATKAS
jgi:UDP-N-acetylmuramoyl-L-alanyl-D-glutamate--2,6-diaminopimelate ligase